MFIFVNAQSCSCSVLRLRLASLLVIMSLSLSTAQEVFACFCFLVNLQHDRACDALLRYLRDHSTLRTRYILRKVRVANDA